MENNITKTIKESLETLKDVFRKQNKTTTVERLFSETQAHLLQSQIRLIDSWIASLKSSKKEGLQEKEYTDDGQTYTCPSCKECGDHDDCDCSGYNSALEDQISSLEEVKKSLLNN